MLKWRRNGVTYIMIKHLVSFVIYDMRCFIVMGTKCHREIGICYIDSSLRKRIYFPINNNRATSIFCRFYMNIAACLFFD